MKRLYSRAGFTLAELLVVVAIIAILVAVAIPTFSSSSKRARAGVCMANRRSALAQLTYAVVLHDGPPLALHDGMKWTDVLSQVDAIEDICPDDGEITLLVRDSEYDLSCSIHGGGSSSGGSGGGSSSGDSSSGSSSGGNSSGGGGVAEPQPWVLSGKFYEKNELCYYKNAIYRCVMAHRTNGTQSWEPGGSNTLWVWVRPYS